MGQKSSKNGTSTRGGDKTFSSLADLTPDPANARKHNPRNVGMLVDSLHQVGAARSIVVDENGVVLAGNATIEAAAEAGIHKVKTVEADGSEIVAVVRRGLSQEQKTKLALYDNRVAELAEWNPEILSELVDTKALEGMFSDKELAEILTQTGVEPKPWRAEDQEEFFADEGDGIELEAGYRLGSVWYGMTAHNEVRKFMLDLPARPDAHEGATVKMKYSRTKAGTTERIVKTYMREGDQFYEQCCGWMTFSGTAKYFGFSGRGGDIWETSLEFCKRQLAKMPGAGVVDVVKADCRDTGEPSESYDFVHSNPPFFNLEPYGDSPDDLASLGSYERWLDAMADMGKEAARILKSGGLANFVINDTRRDGVVIPMHADFTAAIQRKSGMVLHDIVVAEVISQALRFRKHDFERRRTVKCHEYIITFKKPEKVDQARAVA